MTDSQSASLKVKHIAPCVDVASLASHLDRNGVEWNEIDRVNWPEAFPYKPRVQFRIAHSGDSIMLEYRCAEQWVRALAEDNGRIWEDSCVEFFVSLDGTIYYNVEFNCAGKMLMGGGSERNGRQRATPDVLSHIRRSSGFNDVFDNAPAPDVWKLAVIIPVKAFFLNNLSDVSGLKVRGNFYKCGDMTPIRHYLSWSPVDTPAPNFHIPAFFGEIEFLNPGD